MSEANRGVSRRRFLEVVGAAGIGSVIGSKVFADSNEPNGQKEQSTQPLELPKRKLGKTGVEISSLAMGVAFNAVDNQIHAKR